MSGQVRRNEWGQRRASGGDEQPRRTIFLYGTLTDLDVLAHVLGRPLVLNELVPATIDGFRRVQAAGVSYPLLVPDESSAVPGLLLCLPSPRDIICLDHFESGEYVAQRHHVRLEEGSTCEAWLYMGLPDFVAGEEAWDLAGWQERHKEAFLALCDEWMADCPESN